MVLRERDPVREPARAGGDATRRPPLGRNAPCHCGSGRKYKRCCMEHDRTADRERDEAALPAWIIDSRGKLQQFEKYAYTVFDLPGLLGSLSDRRRDPTYPTSEGQQLSSPGGSPCTARGVLPKVATGCDHWRNRQKNRDPDPCPGGEI